MQWFNQQVFEKKLLSEPAFQIINYSPPIISLLYETHPFAALLQACIHSSWVGQTFSLATLLVRCPHEFGLAYLKKKVIYFKSRQEAQSYFSESYFLLALCLCQETI